MFWSVAVLYFDYIPWWGALLISLGVGVVSMLLVQFVLVPYEKKRVVGEFTVLCTYVHTNATSLFRCAVESSFYPSNEVAQTVSVVTMYQKVKLNDKPPVITIISPVNVTGHFC
jgi:hypothetical protein